MTTTPIRNVIPITDDRGNLLVGHNPQPTRGSVVLTSGEYGTAWQRHFSDGRWHPTTPRGGSRTWRELLRHRNLVLVYDAPIRPGWEGES